MVKNKKGITLVALVVTIIVLIILAGVSINMMVGKNGIFSKTQIAANKYNAAEAEEKMNLKKLAIQTKSLSEEHKIADLQYIADELCEDDEVEYVKQGKAIAKLDKIDVTGYSSILVKLKAYAYEFEIGQDMQVAVTGGDEAEIAVEAIALDNTELGLEEGGTAGSITATISPNNASNTTITWTSSDTSVVTIQGADPEGKVTTNSANATITVNPVSAGTATITATSNNEETATCAVTVETAKSTVETAKSYVGYYAVVDDVYGIICVDLLAQQNPRVNSRLRKLELPSRYFNYSIRL